MYRNNSGYKIDEKLGWGEEGMWEFYFPINFPVKLMLL